MSITNAAVEKFIHMDEKINNRIENLKTKGNQTNIEIEKFNQIKNTVESISNKLDLPKKRIAESEDKVE